VYKNIKGLEKVEFMRTAYAIEYDAIDSTMLKRTLEHKEIKNLFFAGQINGSSGYEEAAAQGLMAGINASLNVLGREPFILDRSEAYIGVLIDDLVTKGTNEPYRMMTSRAEYRLTLRQDNADLRLTKKGYELGLVSRERYEKTLEKERLVNEELDRLKKVIVTPTKEVNEFLYQLTNNTIKTGVSLYDLLKRPELSYDSIKELDPDRPDLPKEIRIQVEIEIKYEGYIKKQMSQIEQFKRMENKAIPEDIDYKQVKSLSTEALQKLEKIRPESIGQASRISGVSPSDINVLLIHLEQLKRRGRLDK
jgi:tRNA uridine 5-carboxymethylaminomethyl modification enzyme